MKYYSIYLYVINALALVIFGLDKWNASHQKQRFSEAMLLGLAVLGGWAGALVGMGIFHHKTKKIKFIYGIPCIGVVWLVALWQLASRQIIIF